MARQAPVYFQETEAEQTPERGWLQILDAVRGATALYVVCHHAVLLLMRDMAQVHHFPLSVRLLRGIFGLFGFGHQAVIVFFVLSGFSIHFRQAQGTYNKKSRDTTSRFAIGAYFKRRLRRIAPPYYFALLLTAILCWLTRLVDAYVPSTVSSDVVRNMLTQHNDWLTLAGNIVFLQRLKFETFGNNSPLWSLAFEFYFYLLYPFYLKLRAMVGPRRTLGLIFLLSVLATIWSFHVPAPSYWLLPILGYWFCWVLGAFAADVYTNCVPLPRLWRNIPAALISTALWLGACAFLRERLDGRISDPIGAMVSAHGLYLLLMYGKQSRLLVYLEKVGAYSYTLYLTHMPVLILIRSLWLREFSSIPAYPWLFVIGVTIALLFGKGSYYLVERRFSNSHLVKVPTI